MKKLRNRFENFVTPCPNTGCHWWLGGMRGNNYGSFRMKERKYGAHRMSLHIYKGFDLNSSLLVRHTCHNKLCVNPEHLLTGTSADNGKDQVGLQKSLCKATREAKPFILKDLKNNVPVKDIAMKYSVSNETIYRWRKELINE